MEYKAPNTPDINAAKVAETSWPASSEESIVDPPDYIAPDQQDMMLLDIASKILHRETHLIGRGKKYLSLAEKLDESFADAWPTMGVIFGNNSRLMINIPTRRRGEIQAATER